MWSLLVIEGIVRTLHERMQVTVALVPAGDTGVVEEGVLAKRSAMAGCCRCMTNYQFICVD